MQEDESLNLKPIILSIIILFFLILPFICLQILRSSPHSIFTNIEFNYPFFVFCGLIVSFFAVSKYTKVKDNHRKNFILLLLKSSVIIYALFILIVTYSRYANFISESVDVTYYHSAIWQMSEFRVPYIWDLKVPVWSQHFEPVLFFIVPIYWLVKSAGLIMLIQALVIISGMIPLYMISKRLLGSRLIGLAIVFAYMSFGGLQYGIEYGFHPIMFFPTFFFWTYYFYIKRNIKFYFLFVLLTLFIKEEVAFIMFFWSIYLLIAKKEKIFSLGTMGLAIFWYFLCFKLIIPHFNHGEYGYWGQYEQTGGKGLSGIIGTLFLKPQVFFSNLVTPSFKIDTIFLSFGTFSFLTFLYPISLLMVIPSLMIKLLSSDITGVSGTHYSAALTGVITVATIESVLFLSKKPFVRRITSHWNIFLGVLIFYVAFFANTINGYHAYSIYDIFDQKGPSDENLQVLEQVLNKIPQDATVATQYQIVPHIYKINKVWIGPSKNEKADIVIIDAALKPVLTNKKDLEKNIENLAKNSNYQLILNNSGVYVFQRKKPSIDF